MEVTEIKEYEKYLGLPIVVGKKNLPIGTFKGKSVGKIARLEGNNFISSRQGSLI